MPGGFVAPDAPLPKVPSQGDDSYHVELPPLNGAPGAEKAWDGRAADSSAQQRVAAEAGLPAPAPTGTTAEPTPTDTTGPAASERSTGTPAAG
ncbi:hypothetical protein ACWD5R_02405 [Streptomyces sp. NPDC002514]|uniref:hypothetical protein n=1 Tax=Streptomyces sp. NPDC001270 TaxID=3364554 RepID=UPI00369E60CF